MTGKVKPSRLTPFMKQQMRQAAGAFVTGIFLTYVLVSTVFTVLRALYVR
jgi:hypothetical protein